MALFQSSVSSSSSSSSLLSFLVEAAAAAAAVVLGYNGLTLSMSTNSTSSGCTAIEATL
jgi:hypothetical protein